MEGTIGEIRLFAGDFVPRHWLPCEGQTLAVNANQALYSIVGDRFGLAGRGMFKLPDLRQELPDKALRYIICAAGVYPSRG